MRDADRIALVNAGEFWATAPVEGVPAVRFGNGPNGVQVQDPDSASDHLGLGTSIPATCFPAPVALAQTWSPSLIGRVGAALAVEARAVGVDVLLGPGINIKRDPRGGRNFEYYSEDPWLAGRLAASWVKELQVEGVGASLKHFAANNTEHERFRSSSDVDERTLRELYLSAFGHVVREAEPWTVMCSYNKVNGVYASQNRFLLTEVLRDEWGFDGVTISDWGAVDDRVAALNAGLDLAMPTDDGGNARSVEEALAGGEITSEMLAASSDRVVALARKAEAARAVADTSWSIDAHHALAREVAAQGIVLLTNSEEVLPLTPAGRLAVIGEFATAPRYQGGGSAKVNATRVDSPLDELVASAARLGDADIVHAEGWSSARGADHASLRAEAAHVAAGSDAAVLFLGLAQRDESEGFDRNHIELPAGQIALLRAVSEVQPKTVVVLMHGGVVRVAPLLPHAAALVDASLLGQAAGGAIADVLFGVINPSGRLAETVPERLEDVPAFSTFSGDNLHVRYSEGVLVGYRWYDRRSLPVAFPFGHGLTYTTFEYSDLVVTASEDALAISATVTNSGTRAGREVAQVYIGIGASAVERAPRELKGFTEIELEPGESGRVAIEVPLSDLAYWDTGVSRWIVEPGEYRVWVGASSRDLRLDATVALEGESAVAPLTPASSVAEVLANPVGAQAFGAAMAAMFGGGGGDDAGGEGQSSDDGDGMDMIRMIGSTPIGRFASSLGGQFDADALDALLDAANAAVAVPSGI